MKIIHFDSGRYAYIRVTGPYGENYEPACRALSEWADQAGIVNSNTVFVYLDDPVVTAPAKCRTDIGLLVNKPERLEGVEDNIELGQFDGGKYAVIRRIVTGKSRYKDWWDELLMIAAEQELRPDFRPCFELYHCYDPDTEVADVSFCYAVR